MDVLGTNAMIKTQKPFKRSRRNNKGIKVVYISSPMKVKTSASEFRAMVHELTGRHSDAERFIESINAKSDVAAGDNGEGSLAAAMKKGGGGLVEVEEDSRDEVDESGLGLGLGFGFGFGFGLCDFLSSNDSPLLHEFGNDDSIIF